MDSFAETPHEEMGFNNMDWPAQLGQEDGIHGDRRNDRRYRIHLELRWKLIRRRRVLDTGTGQTVDLSSGGILFDPGRQLPMGLNVELAIAWPVLLRNEAPMQLIVSGRIVRSGQNRAAVSMTQHEFRTQGSAEQRAGKHLANPPTLLLANGTSGGSFGKFR
jgi:hypothetical protein